MALATAIRCFFASETTRRNAKIRRKNRAFRSLEALEDRKLMTVTDVADAAALLGHVTPGTHLYLNFDGGQVPTDTSGNNFDTVRPFESEAGDTNLTHRNDDIQNILFQVSEVFAPFDVQVVRAYGAGNYSQGNGDTTIFIGGNSDTSSTTVTANPYSFTKSTHSWTPSAFVDAQTDANVNLFFPVGFRKVHLSQDDHTINSDTYDIAFIDPTFGSTNDPTRTLSCQSTITTRAQPTHADVATIRQAIVHEAGHTFGLSHVRSDGGSDPTALGVGTTPDIMSYDTSDNYVANKSLLITSANFNGQTTNFGSPTPHYYDSTLQADVTLATQNSFRTLQNVLGKRSQDAGPGQIADTSLVDPSVSESIVNLTGQTIHFGDLTRQGDYQVYSYASLSSGYHYESFSVKATTGNLSPVIMMYDSSGTNLLSVARANNQGVATISNLKSGSSFIMVVGGRDGVTTGNYDITITTHSGFDRIPINNNYISAIIGGRALGTPIIHTGLTSVGSLDATTVDQLIANGAIGSDVLDRATLLDAESDPDALAFDPSQIDYLGPVASENHIVSTTVGPAVSTPVVTPPVKVGAKTPKKTPVKSHKVVVPKHPVVTKHPVIVKHTAKR